MSVRVSVIIPCRNAEHTIGACLRSLYASQYGDFEVIVVDDASTDGSRAVIEGFPCRLVCLQQHSGASAARNAGAACSTGRILFFTDADCLVQASTLHDAVSAISAADGQTVLGGTYETKAADDLFYSHFQSVFVNHNEARLEHPDYLATHALVIRREDFHASGGFTERFLPMLEDVEFSHRLRRQGYELKFSSRIRVRHVFGYSLTASLQNAFRKSMYWTAYSLHNGDLHRGSGTASPGLKLNGISWLINISLLVMALLMDELSLLAVVLLILAVDVIVNRGLIAAFFRSGDPGFAVASSLYYLFVYPVAVLAGGVSGLLRFPQLRRCLPAVR